MTLTRAAMSGLAALSAALLTCSSTPSSATSASAGFRAEAPPGAVPDGRTDWGDPVTCRLDASEPTAVTGSFSTAEAKTLRMIPFRVPAGTTRVEVGYSWTDVEPSPPDRRDRSTIDLGLWDADGYVERDGFRGWSGDRQGRLDKGMAPVFVQSGSAERGYVPGPIEPGVWHVQLGAGGVAPNGATYRVELRCHSPASRPGAPADEEPPTPDPVDPAHVANPEPGWYLGDFHLHAYHSNPKGLAGSQMAEAAIAKGLDIIPVTEYVTSSHWNQLGATQRRFPDVVIWPGREIITYSGHAIVLGETPSTVEYRHGFEGVSMGAIQQQVKADGALFSLAHPTLWPPGQFGNICRGCFFELGDEIDWGAVDLMELHTGDIPPSPFTPTAIELWEQQLTKGHRITGVSGSDDKLGEDYGATATAVYATELSRAAVTEALRAGHAYVLVLGPASSPRLDVVATSPDGETAMFGDTLVGATASATVTVTGGAGQELDLIRNGEVIQTVPIDAETFTTTVDVQRDTTTEGPLGTFWRIQTRDGDQLTTIANPIYLADERPAPATTSTVPDSTDSTDATDMATADPNGREDSGNPWPGIFAGAAVVIAGSVMIERGRRRRSVRNTESSDG